MAHLFESQYFTEFIFDVNIVSFKSFQGNIMTSLCIKII